MIETECPVEALCVWIDKDLIAVNKKLLNGPDSILKEAVELALVQANKRQQLIARMPRLRDLMIAAFPTAKEQVAFYLDLAEALLGIRKLAGTSTSAARASFLGEASVAPPQLDSPLSLTFSDGWRRSARTLEMAERFDVHQPTFYWTLMACQQDLARDAVVNLQPYRFEDRTSILFGSVRPLGLVLRLHAERLPGPSLVTPHWWNLGMANLGMENQLRRAIERGLERGLGLNPYHIRWWLSDGGLGWPNKLEDCESATVASYCLARALCDMQSKNGQLLDPASGISAKLPSEISRHDVEPVDFIGPKLRAAQKCKIHTVVVPRGCERGADDEENRLLESLLAEDCNLQPIDTLDQAYDALLYISPDLRSWKAETTESFGLTLTQADWRETVPKPGFQYSGRQKIEGLGYPHRYELDIDLANEADLRLFNQARATNSFPLAEPFLVRQTVWLAASDSPQKRWNMGVMEEDPGDERVHESDFDRYQHGGIEFGRSEAPPGHWKKIDRLELVKLALSADQNWRRVAIVCGAGLGKTTNLQWLAARINGNPAGSQLAFTLELSKFANLENANAIHGELVKRITSVAAEHQVQTEFSLKRMLAEGRIHLLLDSLDQAEHSVGSQTINNFIHMLKGVWKKCPVWVSGRPYSFRTPGLERKFMEALGQNPTFGWQFVRIGKLDENEAKVLLEIPRRPLVATAS